MPQIVLRLALRRAASPVVLAHKETRRGGYGRAGCEVAICVDALRTARQSVILAGQVRSALPRFHMGRERQPTRIAGKHNAVIHRCLRKCEPPRVALIPRRLEMGTEAEGTQSFLAWKIYAGIVNRRLPAGPCRARHKGCKCSQWGWECVPYRASGPRGIFATHPRGPPDGPMRPSLVREGLARMRERRPMLLTA